MSRAKSSLQLLVKHNQVTFERHFGHGLETSVFKPDNTRKSSEVEQIELAVYIAVEHDQIFELILLF